MPSLNKNNSRGSIKKTVKLSELNLLIYYDQAVKDAEHICKDLVKEVPQLSEKDDLPVYLHRFEQAAQSKGVSQKSWAGLLHLLFVGSVLRVWVELIQTMGEDDYDGLKGQLFDRLGYSWNDCARSFMIPGKPSDQSWDSHASTLKLKWAKLTENARSVAEARELLIKVGFLNMVGVLNVLN